MICIKFKTLEELFEEFKLQGVPKTTKTDIAWAEFDGFMRRKHKDDTNIIKNETDEKQST